MTTTIRYPDRPWPSDWEQQPGLDDCLHEWEQMAIESRPGGWDLTCQRCTHCGAPRCIRRGCIERRHHQTLHIFEDGTFEPVGGVLTEEEERR